MLTHPGEWDEALAEAEDAAPVLAEARLRQDFVELNSSLVVLRARRGDLGMAKSLADSIVAQVRDIVPMPYLRDRARLAAAIGYGPLDAPQSVWERDSCLDEPACHGRGPGSRHVLPDAVRAVVALGVLALAEAICESIRPAQPMHGSAIASSRAMVADARGEHEAAAAGFAAAALAGTTSTYPTRRRRRCLGRAAACWRSTGRRKRGRCWDRPARSSHGSARSRRWRSRTSSCGRWRPPSGSDSVCCARPGPASSLRRPHLL